MRKLFTAMLLCALVSACNAQPVQEPAGREAGKPSARQSVSANGQTMNDEQVLSGIYRQINQAMLAKDTATIDKLTADAFTLTHITGYKQSKDEWLNHIKTDKMQYHQIDEQSVQVAINGGLADIVGKAKTRATIWGAHGTWNLQLHYQAVKTGGAWQVQSAVASLY